MLVQARIGHKSTLEETRIGRLLVTSRANHGRVPWPMVYYGARTGRFSGYDKLNMQNLPKGTAIRKALYAPEGHKLVVADLSQIEARVLAVMAGQEKLIAGFRAGDDVYRSAAADIYNKLPSEVTDEERFVGKTAILGLGYGCGSTKFRTMLGTKIHRDDLPSGEMCFNIVQNYRTQFGAISDYWRRCDRILRAMEGGGWTHIDEWLDVSNQSLLLPQGRVLYYPEIHTARTEGERWGTETLYRDGRGNWTKIYGGKLCENIVQAVAQIIMRDIELRIHTLVGHAGIVAAGQLHDELIYCVPSDHAEKFALLLKREMTRPPEWMPTLPMNCTIAIGDTYDEAK
jgi:DNA polymerase